MRSSRQPEGKRVPFWSLSALVLEDEDTREAVAEVDGAVPREERLSTVEDDRCEPRQIADGGILGMKLS